MNCRRRAVDDFSRPRILAFHFGTPFRPINNMRESVDMNCKRKTAVAQDPFLWSAMARSSVAAASQMVWQAPEEVHEQRDLFVRVTGLPVDEPRWRKAVTWNGAVLLALSAEQSLKALAIMASETSEHPYTHDLVTLWEAAGDRSRVRISAELRWVRGRMADTRLAQGTMGACEIVHHHRKTFEMARYYNETNPTGAPNELTHNIDLWQFALAVYRAARLALTTAVSGMDQVADDVDWEDVLAFNRRIGRCIPEWG